METNLYADKIIEPISNANVNKTAFKSQIQLSENVIFLLQVYKRFTAHIFLFRSSPIGFLECVGI